MAFLIENTEEWLWGYWALKRKTGNENGKLKGAPKVLILKNQS